MNSAQNEPLHVLRFWRDLEVFNIPEAPSRRDNTKQTTVNDLRRGEALPWKLRQFAPTAEYGYVHLVCLGVANMESLSRLLIQSIFPDLDLSERERQNSSGKGWIAAFVVDELGRAKLDSYLPASFAQGVAALREAGTLDNINARLERAKEEFAKRRHPITDQSEQKVQSEQSTPGVQANTALDWRDLDEETRIARSLFGEAANDPRLDWHVVVRTGRVQRRYLDEALQAANDFMNSFYLDDLDRLIAQAGKKLPFGNALSAYLGPALPDHQRIDILTDHAAMSERVTAKRLPSARWPSSPKHPLVLAQQAAVSQIIASLGKDEGLIGVNGPPGTGKTTLLCDVIAEIVTERARRLAGLDRPGDVFTDKMIVAGKGFYPIKAEVISGTSIVVTSTNNAAVKNITQELPARKKVADEFSSADYFADVMREVFRAQKVVGEDNQPIETWGVIAAALGNANNRRAFAQGFFRDESKSSSPRRQTEPTQGENRLEAADIANAQTEKSTAADDRAPSMKQILEAASAQYSQHQEAWRQARQDFLGLQAEFEFSRDILDRAEKAALHLDNARSRLDLLQVEEDALRRDIEDRNLELAQQREDVDTQRKIVDENRTLVTQLRAGTSPNLFDRVMQVFGRETYRMEALRKSLSAPTRALETASSALAEKAKKVAVAEGQLRQQQNRLNAIATEQAAVKRVIDVHEKALQAGYDMGAKHFGGAKFWSLPADIRHRASVAVGAHLDELRANLFLHAVELHRLTLLANAGKFISNLRAVHGMLTGNSREKLSPEHRPLLWDVFFFVVPVVSTTLASFDRLFIGMGQNSLGWLLIDEAGQATPQSAAGAIWRSRRAVIVGDPLQIDPVFTVPQIITEELRRRHDVPTHWSPIEESVQTLADRITPFGSWVGETSTPSKNVAAERLWTGMPLRTHRRCDDPMFSVSNDIAYAGQMVQGRVDTAGRPTPWEFSCCLGESAWFDVKSSRVSHPVSEDEIACLLDGLRQLQSEKSAQTKVYVISPFRKVAQACQQKIRDAGFSGVECGTVHTFQGKEAHIVFLVLGTAPGQVGAGARSWASSKPNLLNVAATRAQCRLYVIGDASQWGELSYFREMRRALPVRGVI